MNSTSSNRRLFVCVILLIILAWSPNPVGRWVDGLISQMVTPISEPLIRLGVFLRPPVQALGEDHPDLVHLRTELESSRSRVANLEHRVSVLTNQLREISVLYEEDRSIRYLQVRRSSPGRHAGRISDFRVNAGLRQGMTPGLVAVTLSRQLVGVVESVDSLTSLIKPITDSGTEPFAVRIEYGDPSFVDDLLGSLTPDGKGLFSGTFDARADIQPGQPVRFADESWGSSNIGLLVGYVQRTEPYDRNPLHQVVYVEPSIPVHRLSEMYLKVPVSLLEGREMGDHDQ